MNTLEIDAILRADRVASTYYIGTFACDTLPDPSTLTPPFALIANTGSSRTTGEHWVSIFVTLDGTCYYFDSFGDEPVNRIRAFCMHFKRVCFNRIKHQWVTAITCGAYAIFHVHMQSRGHSFISIVKFFSRIKDDDTVVAKWLSHAHNFHFIQWINFGSTRLLNKLRKHTSERLSKNPNLISEASLPELSCVINILYNLGNIPFSKQEKKTVSRQLSVIRQIARCSREKRARAGLVQFGSGFLGAVIPAALALLSATLEARAGRK